MERGAYNAMLMTNHSCKRVPTAQSLTPSPFLSFLCMSLYLDAQFASAGQCALTLNLLLISELVAGDYPKPSTHLASSPSSRLLVDFIFTKH